MWLQFLQGVTMAKRYYNSGYYEGAAETARQEAADGDMLKEDRSAVANMPQNLIMKPYPKTPGYSESSIDDSIRGIDEQMRADHAKKMAHFKPKKV